MVTGHIDRHFSLKMNRISAGGHISFEPCTMKIRKPNLLPKANLLPLHWITLA